MLLLAMTLVMMAGVGAARAGNLTDVDVRYGRLGIAAGVQHLALGTNQYRLAIGTNFVQRYRSDGMLDRTFGLAGTLEIPGLAARDTLTPAYLDPDGRLTAIVRNEVVRYAPNGSDLDQTFGSAGRVDLAQLGVPDDLYAAGLIAGQGGTTIAVIGSNTGEVIAIQLDSLGRADRSFGTNGTLSVPSLARIETAATLTTGDLVIAGEASPRCSAQCSPIQVFDASGGFKSAPVKPDRYAVQRIRPMPDGSFLFAGASFESYGPITYPVTATFTGVGRVNASGVASAVNVLQASVEGDVSVTAPSDIAARGSAGYVIATRTSSLSGIAAIELTSLDRRFRPTTSFRSRQDGQATSTISIIPLRDIGFDTRVDITRATPSTIDVRVQDVRRRGTQPPAVRAARMRVRTDADRLLRDPGVQVRWPRSRYVLARRLVAPVRIVRGGRSIVDTTSTGTLVDRKRRGHVLYMPLMDGENCGAVTVTDSLMHQTHRERCFIRPGIPDEFVVRQGCTLGRDSLAYLGSSLRCRALWSSARLFIDKYRPEFVLVLRTCPGCGVLSIRTYRSDAGNSSARRIDLQSGTRGRRVVKITGPTYADRAIIRVRDARTRGVVVEGLDGAVLAY